MTQGERIAEQQPEAVADEHPILTPEHVVDWQHPTDPQISPAGDRIAFTLQQASRPDDHDRSSIWLVDLAKETV
ncbi:MAG: hypothetical protein ACRDFS_08020, partial [Chloroflexota bacterium]